MTEDKKSPFRGKLKSVANRVLASLTSRVIFEIMKWAFSLISLGALSALGLSLVRSSWQVKLSALAILGSVVVLIYLILRSHRRQKKELLHFKSIVESCGIEGFWPFTTQQEKESGWKDCTTKMADSKWGEICIAGLTGAHTFADEGAPLYTALREHRGDIRILLIKKDSKAFQQRIAEMAGDDLAKAENLRMNTGSVSTGRSGSACGWVSKAQTSSAASKSGHMIGRPSGRWLCSEGTFGSSTTSQASRRATCRRTSFTVSEWTP
jgi:hypothetical protein